MNVNNYKAMLLERQNIRTRFDSQIVNYLNSNPLLSYRAVAKYFGCGLYSVFLAAKMAGINRNAGVKPQSKKEGK